jgi:uncharacterized protein
MTPQEQQLVADLFERLASLESQRRDPDAERVIREGLGRAPNSVYALVQTVLVQDEALKRANARIEELERAGQEPAPAPAGGAGGGFLDSMRSVLTGRDQRGSVPSVRPGGQGSSGVWGGGPRPQAAPAVPPSAPSAGGQMGGQFGGSPGGGPMGGMGGMGGGMMGGGGSSFLGTAAATVAGVVGGAMLLNGIRSMMGGGGHQAFGDYGGMSPGSSPWDSGDHGSGDRGSGDLARDAGLGDIGSGHRSAAYDDSGHAGAFDSSNDQADDDGQDIGQADDDYAGGFDSGDDSDTA